MENGGNAKVNAIFEARLEHFGTHASKPGTGADGRTRERYIRDKYERRKYFDASAFHTFQEESEEDSEESEEDEPKRKSKNSGGKIAPLRAPSDAAKKRAESRRTRLAAARGKETKTKSAKKAPPKAPAPAPEVDLLDFGDFTSATPESEPPAQQLAPPPSNEPVLDLFATMTVTTNTADDKAEDKISFFAGAGAPPPAVPPPSPPGQPEPQPETKKVLNNDEILSMFNTAQSPNQMGYGYGGGMNNNMMTMNNGGMNFNNGMMPNAMMPQNMGNVPQNMTHMMQVQQQQRNMMMMGQVPPGMNMMMQMQQQTTEQQQKTRMMMMMQQQQQQPQYNMGNVNMNQQHIAMMNQLQMGNSMMMMATAPGNGEKSNNQEFGLYQQGQTPQQNQAAGMNGFGF